ncbi:hypothetical protein [uncultured Dialister sp.]|uniref:phage neck terminator protein n=1 Tax=uncultured Dialister sp. TaxID=278064 RepID=UPI0026DB0AE1|nr:hypothetical protein [uncultured Dialister sp.]
MKSLTRREIMAAFYRATMTALGLDPDKEYGKTKPPVRLTYPTHGAPDWTVKDDVVFLTYTDVSGDDTSQPVHEKWIDEETKLIRRHFTNRVIQIGFTAYGPNGYDNLLKIRHAFYDGSPVLRAADLMLIPSPETPQYVPENYQNMWWDRTDMSLRFNNTMWWDETVSIIQRVDITIKDNPKGSGKTTTEGGGVKTDGDHGIIIKKG